MRASHYFIATQKETPADAEVVSHQLMLRAGMIRKLASGLYNWLPLGLRVLRKVEKIVREEMDAAGAQELLMPVVQPSELWLESGRWQAFGPELLRIADRHSREFCLGPTHEEVITELVRNELSSYKQLPCNFYQIQTKFRDEVRPRFGVMRAREFLMKDAYSFHADHHCLEATYRTMYDAYCRILDRIGLDYRPVIADTGSIGGSGSHEFHVLADSGEDDIAFSTGSDYAANVELAEALPPETETAPELKQLEEVATPNKKSIEEVADFLNVDKTLTVKTMIALGRSEHEGRAPLVALVLRGDHHLNPTKLEKLEHLAKPFTLASEERLVEELGLRPGCIGPINLPVETVIIDHSAAALHNFVCGANKDNYHLINVNWQRDFNKSLYTADIRNICEGDPSPDGKGTIAIKRGIEVGHIFQLGTKYSQAMGATVQDEQGKERPMIMGCYGIGVSRVVAAAIEQNHDERGIIWPSAIAPFQLAIVPVNMHKSETVKRLSENLYDELRRHGIDVILMDDAKARLGATLADIELMGLPHRIVVGERGIKDGVIEYRARAEADNQMIPVDDIQSFLLSRCTTP